MKTVIIITRDKEKNGVEPVLRYLKNEPFASAIKNNKNDKGITPFNLLACLIKRHLDKEIKEKFGSIDFKDIIKENIDKHYSYTLNPKENLLRSVQIAFNHVNKESTKDNEKAYSDKMYDLACKISESIIPNDPTMSPYLSFLHKVDGRDVWVVMVLWNRLKTVHKDNNIMSFLTGAYDENDDFIYAICRDCGVAKEGVGEDNVLYVHDEEWDGTQSGDKVLICNHKTQVSVAFQEFHTNVFEYAAAFQHSGGSESVFSQILRCDFVKQNVAFWIKSQEETFDDFIKMIDEINKF